MTLPDPLARFRLDGRTALVTGARREIGRAIAEALAGVGARVAVHHAGGDEETRDARSVVAAIGPTAQAFAADFSVEGAAAKLADEVAKAFGRVDILVLNASIEILEPVGQITRAAYDRQMAINVWSTLELIQALVPPMAARGWGRVVTIGSGQQQRPVPEMLVYAGYKAPAAQLGDQPGASALRPRRHRQQPGTGLHRHRPQRRADRPARRRGDHPHSRRPLR